ncbi:hypothetical protein [Streptomyces sp. NBC_00467]|uniref:hypothetical protein n=1 Tax=Streptomyces sp. NBC_00467 TaxID=2975752 RepID=UPI002E18470D
MKGPKGFGPDALTAADDLLSEATSEHGETVNLTIQTTQVRANLACLTHGYRLRHCRLDLDRDVMTRRAKPGSWCSGSASAASTDTT